MSISILLSVTGTPAPPDALSLFLASPLFLIPLLPVSHAVARVFLKPLYDAPLKDHVNLQYSLADIYVLTLHLALSGASVFSSAAFCDAQERLVITLGFWLLLSVWWVLGIRVLNRSGVSCTLKRMVCLAVAIPLSHGLSVAMLVMPLFHWLCWERHADGTEILISLVLCLLLWGGLCWIYVVCRAIAHWIVGNDFAKLERW